MLPELLVIPSELATGESIAALLLYIAMGAGWAYRGYRKNRALRGESWSSKRAVPTLVAGGLVGLGVVVSGHSFDSGHVMAVAGFLVPLLDSLWNAAREATTTATDMAKDGASIPEIGLEVAEVVDREVAVEDVMAVVAEYERRFGTLDPDPEHVTERAKQLKQESAEGGPETVYDRFGPEEAVESDETAPERRRAPSTSVGRPPIVEGPVVGPDPDSDAGSSEGGDEDGGGEETDDEPIHESA